MAAQQPESNLDSILEILQDEPFIGGGPGEQVQLRGTVTQIANRWIPDRDSTPYFAIDDDGVSEMVEKAVLYPHLPVTKPMVAGNNFQYLVYRGLLQTNSFQFDDSDQKSPPLKDLQDKMYDMLPEDPALYKRTHMLETPVEAYDVRGRIDCLLECAGKGRCIVEFKWTRDAKDPDPTPQQGLQLLLYQWLLGKMKGHDVAARMYLIRYNEARKQIKRFRFVPKYQYSKKKSTQKNFNEAISNYKKEF